MINKSNQLMNFRVWLIHRLHFVKYWIIIRNISCENTSKVFLSPLNWFVKILSIMVAMVLVTRVGFIDQWHGAV